MPDEFEFKNYKSMKDYSKSLEGTKYLHDLYLKAVNHPVRREILEIVNKAKKISKKELLKVLICLLYTSPSPRDRQRSRMPSSA